MRLKLKSFLLSILCLTLCACSANPVDATGNPSVPVEPSSSGQPQKELEYPYPTTPDKAVFTHEPLTQAAIEKINGVSWKENENVPLESLSLLTLTYYGFDAESYTGQMIVSSAVAQEVTEIFKELYGNRFPIEKIRLIDDYGADDNLAMADNNSSAFCYREIDGTDVLSNHSYGVAIDINPVQNPYVRGQLIQPEAGKDYMDRQDVRMGMISPGDLCYNAFISRGWTWGGDWTGPIDYQHFEKSLG